ncbi:MAG: alanine--tRNA ligase [Endomicrobium sp.]|jgi:alanyl-tRNA synthetase|nr:alanine--tRNA ligase [Endomicrobium sp.]
MNKQSVEIKKEFLDFFIGKNCTFVISDSLIPTDDETLLFTSSGMVQFKHYFLGQNKNCLTRATSCQKCFRTSDIEQVGITPKHLTFFEMLGNFSFGDYFKKEAIFWAWEFLTKNMSLSRDKLYITVYKNDLESIEIWEKIVHGSKIIKLDYEDNFWNMGNVGPCGPCSEILLDLGSEMSCSKPACGPECTCNRYLEIWNLVFTQFNREKDGTLKNLSQKNIDTGMGFERLVAVMNGVKSVFDTDLFKPIIENISEILKVKDDSNLSKLKIIADHSRAIMFLISDGILPSNYGRGYVLRRILRRALRQGFFFGYNDPFIYKLVTTIFKTMELSYPELSLKLDNIRSIIKNEEEKFLETLESGLKLLYDVINSYKSKGINIIDGKAIFKLYDTYGFPYDLTSEIAHENGLSVDESGFKIEQKYAQDKSRISCTKFKENDAFFYHKIYEKTGDTFFIGYDNYSSNGKVLALTKESKKVDKLTVGDEGEVILSQTSFYATAGGQNFDEGKIINNYFEGIVKDVFRPIKGLLIVHKIKVLKGSLVVGDNVSTFVNIEQRKQIERHHTATHILHKVLRNIFGEYVIQTGSLIAFDYLRFDFTQPCMIKKNDLIIIEKAVNLIIRSNLKICIEIMDIVKARATGAIALFKEKYNNFVRTVSIKNENNVENYSMELCGGTHVNRTGDIGIFKIISESSISAGVKRIFAVAGTAAENYILDEELYISKMENILNTSKKNLTNKIQKKIDEQKRLEKKYNILKTNLILDKLISYENKIKKIHEINFLFILIDDIDRKMMKVVASKLKEKNKSLVLLIISKINQEINFMLFVTLDYVQLGINAAIMAELFSININGFGGGKSDFAQGGSKKSTTLELNNAIEYLVKYIESEKWKKDNV